ncbi:hypothetical protein QZH41_005405 [Actinostola sp. cb2023]|nr:hypothetical protein QZH41_005405 [Actinostola sp. cb2023]
MASRLSLEQAVAEVLQSDDEENEEEEEVEIEDNQDIDLWLDTFPGQEGINRELFKEIGKELLKPVIKQCSKFMSMISGLSSSEVKKYFSRQLKGRCREHHTVKLLVDDERQLALTYWIKRGQFDLTFQYGEWNTCNYPLHNCQFDPDKF